MTVFFRHSKHLLASLALFGVVGMMLAMRPTPSAMERVMDRGELVVITRPSNTPTMKTSTAKPAWNSSLPKALLTAWG